MANQPTKYKKFVATAATATLVASAIVPVASAASFTDVPADSEYKVFVDKAVELGLFKDAEKFNPTQSVKRSQVVLVMGRLLEENGFTADADYATNKAFSDVSSDELLKYGNIVKKAGVFTGYTDGTLKPNDNINRENMASVFDRAAKAIKGITLVEAAADVEDKTVADLSTALTANQAAIQALRDLEISTADNFNPKGDVQRRHFAKFAVTAVEVIEGLKVEETAELAVKSVKTVNAETIEIELSDAIDAKTSDLTKITASYFEKDAKTPTALVVEAELSEDGKVITLTTATAKKTGETAAVLGFEGKEVTVKVPFEVLTTKDGEFIAPGNFTTKFESVAPTFVAVEGKLVDGETKELVLTFDKKLESVEAVKIGTDVLTVTKIEGEKVYVTSAKALKAGQVDVTVVNAKDYAGNALTTAVQSVTLAEDETAPEVVSVKQVKDTENQVEIVLSEELVADLTTETVTATVGTFTKNAIVSIVKDEKDAKKYVVTLNNEQIVNAVSTVVTFTFAKEVLADAADNKNKEAVKQTVTLAIDQEIAAPTTAVKNNALTLTFAEEVTVKTLADVKVTSAKGEILTGADIFTAVEASEKEEEAGKVFTFTAKEGVEKGAYTVVLPKGFATDKSISANELAETTVTVTVGDIVADEEEEKEFAVASVTAANNVITVDFGTKVVEASAVDLSKYTVAGAALTKETAKIAYAKTEAGAVDQTKVVITLADQTVKASDAAAVVTVAAGIKAINEKTTKAFTGTVAVVENVSPEFKAVVATDVKELTFTFSEDMAIAGSITDEIKLFDKDGKAVAITAATVVEGEVVVSLGEVLASTVTAFEIVAVEGADLTDVAGNEVKAVAKTNR